MLDTREVQGRNSRVNANGQSAALLLVCFILVGAMNWSTRGVEAKVAEADNNGEARQQSASSSSPSASYRDGQANGWMITILKEFFSDIDWQSIATAREQVEKFLHKLERLLKTLTSAPSSSSSASRPSAKEASSTTAADHAERRRNLLSSLFWPSKSQTTGTTTTASVDETEMKAMLERVACFVGYMRILTNTNEALAELDAAKVFTGLLNNSSASKTGGYWSSLFG